MAVSQNEGKMEGWLYSIRQNRFGMQFSRKRYFVLCDNCLKSYKSMPASDVEEPDRSATLDFCIRVNDNGSEKIHRKVFFIFTLYNTSNPSDQLKLGARSPKEAGKWILSLQDAALKGSPRAAPNFLSPPRGAPVRLRVPKRSGRKASVCWPPISCTEAMTSDVMAPSPWEIFGCQNGLQLFKEAKDWDSCGRHWDDHPAIMAVGVVDGRSEDVFRTLMSLGSSRSEGHVVEHLDGHTDIVYMQLYSDWLPWGLKRRDLLVQRYWRREDDGTYVILYHSVYHKKCPPKRGYVRAWLKSGGFVVSPMNQGNVSLVEHMLAIDWKSWRLYLHPAAARSATIKILERLAALREMFRAKQGPSSSVFFSELTRDEGFLHDNKENASFEAKALVGTRKNETNMKDWVDSETDKVCSARMSLLDLHDASDEFLDVPESKESIEFDNFENYHCFPKTGPQVDVPLKLSSGAEIVKKLQDFAAEKKGYVDLQEAAAEGNSTYFYGATLQKDPSHTLACSWSTADHSTFLIRGKNYLKDHEKVKAKGTLMQMIGADWISSRERKDDLGGCPGGIVQKFAAKDAPEFFFIVNIQIPGSAIHSLATYFVLRTPLEEHPLLLNFVNGDDAYRNSRFKLIPHVSEGSWIVKQSVRKKGCLVGQALEVRYLRGKNYLELDIDVGSSTVARGMANLVCGYLKNLVLEMAFLIQGETEEELPEVLLGTSRFNYLDLSKSVVEE